MNKKLSKFLSIFTLFAVSVPFTKGAKRKKNNSQKKIYLQKKRESQRNLERDYRIPFIDELKSHFKTSNRVYKSCFKINKKRNQPVSLNKHDINSQESFNACFNILKSVASELRGFPRIYCVRLMEQLISYGNNKDFTQENQRQALNTLNGIQSFARRLDFDNNDQQEVETDVDG